MIYKLEHLHDKYPDMHVLNTECDENEEKFAVCNIPQTIPTFLPSLCNRRKHGKNMSSANHVKIRNKNDACWHLPKANIILRFTCI